MEPLLTDSPNSGHLHVADSLPYVVRMNMQPSNTNQPPVQRTLLSLDNGQAALHKWMLMYCDKSFTTDKRCGYTKIRRGCIVVMIYVHTRIFMHARWVSVTDVTLWEYVRLPSAHWIYSKQLNPRTRAAGGRGQNQFTCKWIPCVWGSNDSRTRLTELEFSVYKFSIAVVLENEIVGRLPICTLHQLPHRF